MRCGSCRREVSTVYEVRGYSGSYTECEACFSGRPPGPRTILEQAHAMADGLAELWHGSGDPRSLADFMGLSPEEYADFVQGTGAWAPPQARCARCRRDLHGHRGPLCRYCEGTAE